MGAMNWSKYQLAIYEAFTDTADSLLIEAVAGSGKTHTLEELARIMGERMPGLRGVMVAFNKSIAMELQSRIDKYRFRNVQAMTLHSAGWAAWRRAGGLDWEPRVNQHKTSGIMREVLSYEEQKRFGETTRKLVAAAKGIGLVPEHGYSYDINLVLNTGLVEDSEEQWEALMDHYSLDPEECDIASVRKVLAKSIELAREQCDFDDMLYMPVVAGVPFDRYDVVLVDEAQDVSGIQMEMISRMVGGPHRMDGAAEMGKRIGRIIAVGDRNQAIYGFRGAGTDSMNVFQRRFQMRELPLSVTYRCPQDVVTHAQRWVPHLEWADTADFGFVGLEGTDWRGQSEIALEGISKWKGIADFLPGDAILCRLTRPVVAAAFRLIRRRIPCRVLGRDIGAGLVALVRRAKSLQNATVAEFDQWLDDYEGKETARLREKRKHAQAGMLGDRADTLRVFMEGIDEDATVQRLIAEVERMFVDNGAAAEMVTLATVHKAKGLEWPRVFILDAGEFMPCPWARGAGWEMEQEKNVQYIAATRASRELRYITSGDLR